MKDNHIINSHYLIRSFPFTPTDQCQLSPVASPEILHHIVWRTWQLSWLTHLKDDNATNSHYLTYTFSLWKVGRMYFLNLGLNGDGAHLKLPPSSPRLVTLYICSLYKRVQVLCWPPRVQNKRLPQRKPRDIQSIVKCIRFVSLFYKLSPQTLERRARTFRYHVLPTTALGARAPADQMFLWRENPRCACVTRDSFEPYTRISCPRQTIQSSNREVTGFLVIFVLLNSITTVLLPIGSYNKRLRYTDSYRITPGLKPGATEYGSTRPHTTFATRKDLPEPPVSDPPVGFPARI